MFGAGFRARFEKASVILEGSNLKVYPDEGKPYVPEIPAKDPYTEEIRMFANMLLDSSVVNTNNPPESACETVRLIEKLRESAAINGGIVKL